MGHDTYKDLFIDITSLDSCCLEGHPLRMALAGLAGFPDGIQGKEAQWVWVGGSCLMLP